MRPSSAPSASFRSRADCGQLPAERQPAEERQRGLLALGPVDRADAAGREPELEQLGERVGVVAFDLAAVDRGDDVGQAAAARLVLHHREHRLRLGAGDLGRLAASTRTAVVNARP